MNIVKRTVKASKCNVIYFDSVTDTTENYYFVNYNSFYRVHMLEDVNRSHFVLSENRTQN